MTITVKPGETVTIVGVQADSPLPPVIPSPNDPRPTHPIALPGDPWWGLDLKPTHPIVIPPTEPPPVQPPPSDSGNWTWAWSPQAGRWVWVKIPGPGQAGPK
jgi:hypothetical protein